MNSGRVITRVLLLCALLIAPRSGLAQEAALTGSVTDSSGAVLPGVTITAVHLATGNTFVAVTDQRGGYRIPLRIGDYRATAELPGFQTATKTRGRTGWSDRGRQSPALGVGRAGIDRGERRSAACRYCLVNARRKYRQATDAGPADQWPQLDGSGHARARQPAEREQQHPAGAARLLANQHRRPADHAPHSGH